MNKSKVNFLIWLCALSVGTLLISNLAAIKLWNLFGIAVDGGLVLFPLSYVVGDLTVEFLGKETSRKILMAAFAVNIMAAIVFYIVIALPAYPGWELQEAYAAVLGFSPRIIAGSLLGYLSSGLLNNHLFERMKRSNGVFARSFIARALGSSVVAHIVDSAIFETVAFFGVLPLPEFLMQMVFAYFLGMLFELILSPAEMWIEKRLRTVYE